MRKIDNSALRLTGAAAESILLYNQDRTLLRFASSLGEKAAIVEPVPVTDGIAWWVAAQGIPVRTDDAQKDPRFSGAIDRITGFETRSLLCVPMVLEDEIIGVIEVLNKSNASGFTERDERLLSVLAGQAAIAVKNARLATEQRNFFGHVIEILVKAIEATFLVPVGHCWNVARLANSIGRKLGMKDRDLQDLYYAAALHDLGMLRFSDSGVINEDAMRTHPILGANMVRDIDILRSAEPMIRHHHEYLDGSGYPDGLKREEIPIGTKIIAVVEAYEEAIMKGGSQLLAETRIRESAGKLFDPAVVSEFLELMELGVS
jgi:HD-GYP domain-containing protein (c-di-GMP phosphodiesterase class II)